LTLSPQSKILDCDSYGNVLAGLLPFTSQAALFKWNYRLPLVAGIQRFPGNGNDLFDPMLGDFVPTDGGIIFSLENAPEGVNIDYKGIITVSENAALDGEHSVIVKAEYEGAVYEAVFFIQVKGRVGENKYLGTVEKLTLNNPKVTVIKGNPAKGELTAVQGDYVLAVAGGTVGANIWEAGFVYQWTGLAWEKRKPEEYSALYISCFQDGLEVEGLKKDIGWFGGVMAALICAQKGFIEELQTKVITLKEKGIFQSEEIDPETGKPYLLINKYGIEAIRGLFQNSTIEGALLAGDAWDINGNIANPNSHGGLLASRRIESGGGIFYGVRLKNPVIHGALQIGTFSVSTKTIFCGERKIPDTSPCTLTEIRRIEGGYTAADLYNFINSVMFSLENNADYECVPVNGTIYYYKAGTSPSNPGVKLIWHLYIIQKSRYYGYVFRGTRDTGTRIAGSLTNSAFTINEIQSNGNGTNITTISGSDTIDANFVFL